jgi:hypothetical protein
MLKTNLVSWFKYFRVKDKWQKTTIY